MRISALTLGAAAAVVTLAAPPAISAPLDDPAGAIGVSPAKPAPGAQLRLQVTGCDAPTGAAKSRAFVADAELNGPDDDSDGIITGEATLRSTAAPGGYRITVACDGKDKIRGKVTVVAEKQQKQQQQQQQQQQQDQAQQKQQSQPPPSPTAPVRAGGGGTAALAAGTESEDSAEGPGVRHAVIGLLLASAAALAVTGRLARRRRRPQ